MICYNIDRRKVKSWQPDLLNGGNKMANDFSYEIVEHIAVLSTSKSGWTKELNRISWNGRTPKYDIREWAPEHEKMGKGVTLTDEEYTKLKEVLSK